MAKPREANPLDAFQIPKHVRALVRLQPGEVAPRWQDPAPDGFRLETDAEFRRRIQSAMTP